MKQEFSPEFLVENEQSSIIKFEPQPSLVAPIEPFAAID
jgi:hypothetical protein